jgi:hypothetical protein
LPEKSQEFLLFMKIFNYLTLINENNVSNIPVIPKTTITIPIGIPPGS